MKRAEDRENNIRDKRRSWSAAGRDPHTPTPSQSTPRSVTPRGRSSDRATMSRPASAGGASLSASRRLSSSTTNLERRVKLIRLGPYEEDWFECHVTSPSVPARRSSSPGKEDKSFDSPTPSHHLSTPNLACKPTHFPLLLILVD